jgi:hypothetical protein
MAISADQTINLFWAEQESDGDDLYFIAISPNGAVSETVRLLRNSDAHSYMFAQTGWRGQTHLFFKHKNNTAHFIHYPDGSWSGLEILPYEYFVPYSLIDEGDTIQATGMFYFRWGAEQGWFAHKEVPFPGYVSVIDRQGILHTADQTNYYTTARADKPAQISLWQSVSLPMDMHKPTLSFMARWRGGLTGGSSFYDVTVTDGITVTQSLTFTPRTHLWEQHWLALDEWVGKRITVTFTLHQEANDAMVYLDLDDISLGSWLTPVISSVETSETAQFESGQTITIMGENFIQEPTVYIDNTQIAAANLTWINENLLIVKISEKLSVGVYDVQVVNPGGQSALATDVLRIGYLNFYPIIIR